jgi:hypothetical protein
VFDPPPSLQATSTMQARPANSIGMETRVVIVIMRGFGRTGMGVRLAEIDEARDVVGLKHQQAEEVVRADFAAAQPADQEPETAWKVGFELVGQPAQILRWAKHQQVDVLQPAARLRRHSVDQRVQLLEAKRVTVEQVEKNCVEQDASDLSRWRIAGNSRLARFVARPRVARRDRDDAPRPEMDGR